MTPGYPGLSDGGRSRVVLVGTARYTSDGLPDLPAVERNLEALRAALTRGGWGLPPERCTMLLDVEDPRVVLDALADAAAEAEDTLVFYYAGHGMFDPRGGDDQLLLGLAKSEPDRPHQSLSYSGVRRVLREPSGRAKRTVVILDCCFSGLAADFMGEAEQIGNSADITGTYVLTATSPTEMAVSPPDELYTGFTDALLSIHVEGVAGRGPVLDMNTLYEELRKALTARSLPTPRQNNKDLGGKIAFIVNAAHPERRAALPAGDHVPPRVWGSPVPPRNISFTGREGVLDEVRGYLTEPGTGSRTLVLQGMAGVGKTQIAVEYAYRHMGDYDVIWWISVNVPELVTSSVAALATRLGLPSAKTMGIEEAARSVLDGLRRGDPYRRWLVVFDGAGPPDGIRDVIPSGPGHVLITSRDVGWRSMARVLPVDVFDRPSSIGFLRKHGSSRIGEPEAGALAEALGDLPLALEQAGALLIEGGLLPEEFLELLADRPSALLDASRAPEYPYSLATAWLLSVNRLRGQDPSAIDLLGCLAFLGSDPLPIEVLRRAAGRTGSFLGPVLSDPIVRTRTLGAIAGSGLAKVTDRGVQVHRLVQLLHREQLSAADQLEYRKEAHLLLAAGAPDDSDDPRGWPLFRALAVHAEAAEAVDSDVPEVREFVNKLVVYLIDAGDLRAARRLLESALDRWPQGADLDDYHLLSAEALLGGLLFWEGRYPEAREQNLRMLDRVKASGHSNLEVWIRRGVGSDLRTEGSFGEALAHDGDLVARCVASYGRSEIGTLRAEMCLALDYVMTSDYARALDLYRRLYQDSNGAGATDVITVRSGLSQALWLNGDYEEARTLAKDTFSLANDRLGADHHRTLWAATNLAIAWRRAGHDEQAYELARDAYDRSSRLLAPHDPAVLSAAVCLAGAQRRMGLADEAADLMDDAARRTEELYGPDHLLTLICRSNIARLMRRHWDIQAALDLGGRTLAKLDATVGRAHHVSLAVAANLVADQLELGPRQDADLAAMARAHLEQCAALLGPRHPDTLVCAGNLADVLSRIHGEYEAADRLFTETIAALEEVCGPQHPITLAIAAHQHVDLWLDFVRI